MFHASHRGPLRPLLSLRQHGCRLDWPLLHSAELAIGSLSGQGTHNMKCSSFTLVGSLIKKFKRLVGRISTMVPLVESGFAFVFGGCGGVPCRLFLSTPSHFPALPSQTVSMFLQGVGGETPIPPWLLGEALCVFVFPIHHPSGRDE